MVTTAEEDWSIISSSDYEEDSSQSVSRQDKSEPNKHDNDEESAAASVATVRPPAASGQISGSTIRMKAVTETETGSGPAAPSCAWSDSEMKPGPKAGDIGANSVCAHVRAEGSSACQVAPSVCARKSAVCGTASKAWCYTANLPRTIHESAKRHSGNIFGSSLARLHSRLDSSSSCAVQKSMAGSVAFLNTYQSYLLYFVFIAGVTAAVGGILGLTLISQQSSVIASSSDAKWKTNFSHFSGNGFAFDSVNWWCKKQVSGVHSFGKSCYVKASEVLDSALYEDVGKQRSLYTKLFDHTPSKKLRFTRLWDFSSANLRDILNSSRVHPFMLSLKKNFSAHQVSIIYNSWRDRMREAVANQSFSVWSKDWATFSAERFREFSSEIKVVASKSWGTVANLASKGVRTSFANWERASSTFKNWTSQITTDDARENMLLQVRKFTKLFESKYVSITLHISEKSKSILLFASELKNRVGNPEKRDELLEVFEEVSYKGFDLFKKRLQNVALDAFRLSRSVSSSFVSQNVAK